MAKLAQRRRRVAELEAENAELRAEIERLTRPVKATAAVPDKKGTGR